MQGTIIVIEGTNGSGKQTQTKLLTDRLEAEGYEVSTLSFPQYEEPSSYFVRKYLKGDYGSADEVGPYKGSLFYALDRFAAAEHIRHDIDQGKIVVLDRYVGSNMAHQGTKFDHVEERRGFFIWLDNLEFELLRIPRPSKSFVLRVPVETSLALLKERYKNTNTEGDLHEADTDHLKLSLEVYDDMCKLFPKDFTRIDCTYQGSLLPRETVHELLWRQITPLLPPKPVVGPAQKTAAKKAASIAPKEPASVPYVVPRGLSDETARQYQVHIDRILELHGEITTQLTEHLRATGTTDKAAEAPAMARAIADAVLPLASIAEGHEDAIQAVIGGQQDTTARDFAAKYLPGHHPEQTKSQIQLIERTPRNELDALPTILYPHSSLTLRELQSEINSWSYDKKAEVLEANARERKGSVAGTQYTWDIVSSVGAFTAIATRMPMAVSHQACSPRYGYNMPEILEEAGIGEAFETCFDISLSLYSLLQEADKGAEAQYAVLGGHMLRWKLTLSGEAFASIYKALPGSPLVQQLRASIAEAHPLIADSL